MQCSADRRSIQHFPVASISSTFTLWLLSELPALAEKKDFSQGGGFAKESYYVTLGLFVLSLPGESFFTSVLCMAVRYDQHCNV